MVILVTITVLDKRLFQRHTILRLYDLSLSLGSSPNPQRMFVEWNRICEMKACLIHQREQTVLEHDGSAHFYAPRKAEHFGFHSGWFMGIFIGL